VITRALGLKLGRFGTVGIVSTLIYAMVATTGSRWTSLPLVIVTTIAYIASGAWGYFGHYHVTFRSDAAHRSSVAKFVVLFAIGYAVSTGIVLVNHRLRLPPEIGTVIVSAVLPVMNFVIMQLWVFAGRHVEPAGADPPSAQEPAP
jgi:putative flippase GtrA